MNRPLTPAERDVLLQPRDAVPGFPINETADWPTPAQLERARIVGWRYVIGGAALLFGGMAALAWIGGLL